MINYWIFQSLTSIGPINAFTEYLFSNMHEVRSKHSFYFKWKYDFRFSLSEPVMLPPKKCGKENWRRYKKQSTMETIFLWNAIQWVSYKQMRFHITHYIYTYLVSTHLKHFFDSISMYVLVFHWFQEMSWSFNSLFLGIIFCETIDC